MIAIVDYRLSNLRSVANAFNEIKQKAIITDNPLDLKSAVAIVLPGVGAFGDGMRNLHELGMVDALNEEILVKKKPFLGICLGLQFLATEGFEFGRHQGLGWLDGSVKKITPNDNRFKVPHMGWNEVNVHQKTPLFDGLEEKPVFYFVHSFALQLNGSAGSTLSASCWHGVEITAAVQRDNIFAVQFHPEKSQKNGLKLLENFTKIL